MPEEEIQEQIEESPIEPGAVSLDDLKDQVLDFSQKIINLTQNYNDRVEDLELAQEMAQAIKPFVDQISLGWTATGPTKRDFIGVYCSEQGLRFKQLKRTQRNTAWGLCSNW